MASNRQYQRVSNNEISERGNRARWASGVVFFVTSALVIALTVYKKDEAIFVPVEDIRNQTASEYFEKQVTTKCRGFFFCALTFFGVLIAAIVDRLTLVVEERRHVETRYDGIYREMLKACFSGLSKMGISLGIIFAGIVIVVYILLVKIQFKLDYLVLVFSGIGFGPLVQRLLKLDKPSKVHISAILEEQGKLVSNVLAWSYYFNDLKIVLPKIKHAIDNSRWENRLCSRKLVILLPLDGQTDPENLPNVDQRLSKEGSIRCQKNPKLSVDVLSVKCDETPNKYFLFKFASPVETLFFMSEYEKFIALPLNEREQEVKFCGQFLEKIVSDPVHRECKGKCVVIPYEQMDNRSNDRLVKKILETEDSSVPNKSLVVPIEIEHEDETHVNVPSQTTSNINTNVGIATSEETRTEDIADVDSEDQDQQRERSPHSINNQAYITDGIRAKRRQPNNNNPPQPSNNTRPLPIPPQTISINDPRQPSNTTPLQTSRDSPQTMSINNPRQPSNTTPPRTSRTSPQTMSVNNPPQTTGINNITNSLQPSNTTLPRTSKTPLQTMSINNLPQTTEINNITNSPQPSNTTPPLTMSISNPSQSSNSTPSETSDTLPQTTSINNPPQTSNNTRDSMNDQTQTDNPQLCLAAPQLNSGGGLSEDSETPSYEMQSRSQLETFKPNNKTTTVAQVHRNQQGEQRNTSDDEVVCLGAMGMSSIGDNVEGTNGEIQNEKAMDIADLN